MGGLALKDLNFANIQVGIHRYSTTTRFSWHSSEFAHVSVLIYSSSQ